MDRKRKRGRPPGTGLDDSATLAQIADMIVREPSLRPTTAYLRMHPDANDASKRRIQFKWQAQGQRLLAQARSRLSPPKPRATAVRSVPFGLHEYARLVERATFGGLQAKQLGAVFAAQRFYYSREGQAIREQQERLTALLNSPAAQAARDFHNSPAMRAIQDIHNHPAVRAMEEAQALFSRRYL